MYGFVVDSTSIKRRLRAALTERAGFVPLDVSCLLICQLAGLQVDVDHELAALDDLAASIETASFEGVIAGLFAGPRALRGNTDGYYDLGNSLLSEVRRTGLGIPITLSVMAMEVARRKGVAVLGIGMPGHFLIGDGTDDDRFADPFHGARVFDRIGAQELFRRVANGAAWNDEYLRPANNADIMFRIVNNIRVACTKNFTDRHHLPWVLEVLSWFPHGPAFDERAAAKAVAPFN